MRQGPALAAASGVDCDFRGPFLQRVAFFVLVFGFVGFFLFGVWFDDVGRWTEVVHRCPC